LLGCRHGWSLRDHRCLPLCAAARTGAYIWRVCHRLLTTPSPGRPHHQFIDWPTCACLLRSDPPNHSKRSHSMGPGRRWAYLRRCAPAQTGCGWSVKARSTRSFASSTVPYRHTRALKAHSPQPHLHSFRLFGSGDSISNTMQLPTALVALLSLLALAAAGGSGGHGGRGQIALYVDTRPTSNLSVSHRGGAVPQRACSHRAEQLLGRVWTLCGEQQRDGG
jgi:hypothetical protein